MIVGKKTSMLFSISLALTVIAGMPATANAVDLPDFTPLVEKNGPAVVNISTLQKIKRQVSPHGGRTPQLPDAPFDDFFKHFFGDGEQGEEQYDAKSLGSGFIISDDGYILTNNHVIKDAEEIIVRLSDRRELSAELVGTDVRSDLALLKIEGGDLPTVKIGSSKELKVGEWVLAIGSPFGFDHSVTAGIVSAKRRNLPRENYVPFIQTDVAINPGNSGGPLFNLDGEVVGINAQIYSRTGGFMGLSFAIPIDMAMGVVEQLKSSGHVSRGWLGVLIQDVTRELAESFGMSKPYGALVARVLPGSPAEKAGLKVGDVIIKFDDRVLDTSSDLPPLVGMTAVNDRVSLRVIRNGKKQTLKVKIAELPEEGEAPVSQRKPSNDSDNRLNVLIEDLRKEQRQRMGLEDRGGVLVVQIGRGAAYKAGVRRGDVVLMINNVDVKDVRHFSELIKELPTNKSIPVLVQRRGGPIFLAMKIKD